MSGSREKEQRKLGKNSPQPVEKKKLKEQFADRQTQILTAVIAVVLVFAVVMSLFQTIVSSGQKIAAVKIGNEKVYAHEINYFYIATYSTFISQYGDYLSYIGLDTSISLKGQKYSEDQTWHEYFLEQAVQACYKAKLMAKEAEAAGMTLTQDYLDEIEQSVQNIQNDIDTNGHKYDVNYYLQSYYGTKMDETEYRRILTYYYLAQEYSKEKYDTYTFTDDEISTYYNENKNQFDCVDYRSFFFSYALDKEGATEAEIAAAKASAKSLAQIMKNGATNESAFITLAHENAKEDEKEKYSDDNATLTAASYYSNTNTLFADWLFADERVSGDIDIFESEDEKGFYVVYNIKRYREDYLTKNVRHILKAFELAEGEEEPTEQEKADAKVQIDAVLSEYESGDMSEDAFALLAEDESDDTGSVKNGGLYADVYKGQMQTEFENWAFDASRKPGDYGIISTSYGYHLMYFVSNGKPYYALQVEKALRENAYNAYFEELKAANPLKESFLGEITVGLPGR